MAAIPSISATGGVLSSSFHGESGSGRSAAFFTCGCGDDLLASAATARKPCRRLAFPKKTFRPITMGNVNEGKGTFAPLVVFTRNIVGKKRFNLLRGKAIALHSQVITEFCKSIGADGKQRQGLIRLAKKNGEKLGFLA